MRQLPDAINCVHTLDSKLGPVCGIEGTQLFLMQALCLFSFPPYKLYQSLVRRKCRARVSLVEVICQNTGKDTEQRVNVSDRRSKSCKKQNCGTYLWRRGEGDMVKNG